MKIRRRKFLRLGAGTVALTAVSRFAWAQAYPTRPITMIVPIAAGSASDVVGRLVAERMGTALGQPIIIENVPGADGSIGVGRVARARPDGYTIICGFTSSMVMNGAFYSLPYDVLNDFAPISTLVKFSLVLFARQMLPAKNLSELVGWLKANPNRVSAGITTVGFRLLNVFFQNETGTQFTLVPYRGTPPVIQDLLTGRIDLWFGSTDQLALVRAGGIKAYAVVSETRLTLAPDIPTFAELGLPAITFPGWLGLFAPEAPRKRLSANSMGRPWRRWPIRRCGLGSPISEWRFFRASDRRQKPWEHYRKPTPRSGGRSSRSLGSSRNEPQRPLWVLGRVKTQAVVARGS